MAFSRAPLAGILLVAAITVGAAWFGAANWQWLNERNFLRRDGLAATARIDEATISHKTCNSSIVASWTDTMGVKHSHNFMTCFANHSAGQTVGIRYLPQHPETAMIADGEGGLPDSRFSNGIGIGAILAAVMAVVTVHLVRGGIRWKATL